MKQRRLYQKFTTLYLMFFIVGIVCFFALVPSSVNSYLLKQRGAQLQLVGEQMAQFPEISGCSFQGEKGVQTKKLLDYMAASQEAEIWLVNENGRILMNSREDFPMSQTRMISGFDSLIKDTSYRITGTFFGMFHTETLSVITPVTSAPHTTDFVIIHYPTSLLTDEEQHMTNICFLIAMLIYFLSLVLPLGFYFLIHRPLKEIQRFSNACINDTPYTFTTRLQSEEFLGLQENIQYMAHRISQSGEYQRKFISNISHDFRSPLTSIKGYAEAILDGTIPKSSQDKYLEIILTETERLTHLTQNILAVNNLGDKNLPLNLSVFDINEVLRVIASSLEIQCRKKDLHITLSLTSGVLNVNADKEKIQQVIYNLLDNAIKFSYNHSEILIRTSRKKNYVSVTVKDSGIGIPSSQVKNIWSRFYKTDVSRNKDKTGTGLGLSIVKEIIQAHNQNINVISTEGVGSEFIFTLERA